MFAGMRIPTPLNVASPFSSGVNGVYHHVSEEHLKRYIGEFDFRYNERSALGVKDSERATKAIRGVVASA